jgi:epoxide hydrolase 4
LFGWGRLHCVAHDYGAVVAWQYCTLYSERIRSYCALSVGHPVTIVKHPTFANTLKSWFLIYNALPFAVRGYKAGNAGFFRWAMRQHPDQARVVDLLRSDPDPTYIQAWELGNPIGPLLRESLTKSVARFPRLTAPTRGIWGSMDCYADAVPMQKSAQFVDNIFEFVRLEGLGHWLQLEAPEMVTPLILDWARQHDC